MPVVPASQGYLPRHPEITALTGLRGVAAVWVMVGHYASGPATPGNATLAIVAFHGYIAVDLFMVLSGFVLAMTYENLLFHRDRRQYASYLLHRLARIYPLFAITTLACVLLALGGVHLWGDPPTDPGTLAANLLLVHSWGWNVRPLNAAGWSISTEWAANLLLPVFAVLLLRRPMRRSAPVAGTALLCLFAVAILRGQARGPLTGALNFYEGPLALLRCITEFMLGVFCWRLRSLIQWTGFLGKTGFLVAILAAMAPLLLFFSLDLALMVLMCLLVIGLSFNRSPVAGVFGNRIIRWLGTISFSVYLWQMPLLPLRSVVSGWLARAGVPAPDALSALITMAIVIAVSAFSFAFVERPAQRWIRTTMPAQLRAVGARLAGPRGSTPSPKPDARDSETPQLLPSGASSPAGLG